jgi:hypothetical protein
MIQTEIAIRRGIGLWGGVSPETVKRYREELEALKKQLSDFSFLYERTLFGGELRKALIDEIDEELKYCLFYDEFNHRSEPNFGQWVFRKQEDINADKQDWQKVPGDQWTKTNGRVKAIIQFDRRGLMVKISLSYENDSTNLKFYERHYHYKEGIQEAHLKSEASIEARVQQFKDEADAYLNEHLYPLYSQHEAELLKQLLHL